MNWIDMVMAQTEYAETPRSFIRWAALASISAVAAPNVFLDKVYYRLSPNIYVILLAKSGLGKGFPVALAKILVRKANCTRVIEGRNSIQAMVKELGTIRTQEMNGTPALKDSRGFLVSGEFADFVTYDPQAFIILTDLYDTHYNEEWKNSFKNTGIDVLKNPNLTMLGASSPIHFKECLPAASITGGFIGRTLIVYEDKRSRINPLVDKPEIAFEPEELVQYLRELKNIKGEFSWTDSGKRVFKEWYQELRENEDKHKEDDTGTEQRLNDHVLKVAMLLQLAEDKDNLIITAENVKKAVELLLDIARNSKRNLIVDGKSASKDHVTAVLRTLMTRPGEPYTREAILSQNWGHINIMEFDVAVESLKQMAFVEEYVSGGSQFYRLTKKGVNIFFSQAKGRVQ
jgi:hypothetical protein